MTRHFPVLDSVRGTAAIMVMLSHAYGDGVFTNFPLLAYGRTGVDLFFVLSGFLITRILLATKGEPNYFKNFYIRRMLRIFPLYYLFLVIYYFVMPLVQPHPMHNQGSWWFWIYLQNIPSIFKGMHIDGPSHFWSLAVEEHFYLIWPLLVYLIPENKLYRLSIGLIAAAIVCRTIFIWIHLIPSFFTFCRMDGLAFGTLLACLEREQKLSLWLPRFRALSFIALIGLFFLSQDTVMPLFYWAILGWIISAGKLPKIFYNAFLRFTGRISYGLYVYHPVCLSLVFHQISVELHPWLALFLALCLTYFVAAVSFRYFEKPFLNLKKRYGRRASVRSKRVSGSPLLIR